MRIEDDRMSGDEDKEWGVYVEKMEKKLPLPGIEPGSPG